MDVKASGVLGWRMVGSRRMVRWRVVELRDEVFCSTIDGLLEEEEEEEEEEGNKGNKGNKGKSSSNNNNNKSGSHIFPSSRRMRHFA